MLGLEKLCSTVSPSGNEEAIRAAIIDEIRPYVDELRTDAMGNLIARKGSGGKRLLFAAHMDEIGVLVTYIEDGGYIRFQALGGVRIANAIGQRVLFSNGTVGTVFLNGDCDIEKAKMTDLYIDIGALDRQTAAQYVKIGDAAGFVGAYTETRTAVISKSLDNRIGCYVLLEALKRAAETQNEIYAVFTVQEELGLRGATTAAFSVDPDIGFALDVTATGDKPGDEPMAVKLGGGAAIKVKDSRIIAYPAVVDALENIARENGIACQREVLLSGGTDAGAIHLTRAGVPTGAISVPVRYIHSPAELAYLSDIEACIQLTACVMCADLKLEN